MRFKLFPALFSLFIVFFCFILLYQSSFRSNLKPLSVEENLKSDDVLHWEQRLKNIEKDINANKDLIQEIKILISSIYTEEFKGSNQILNSSHIKRFDDFTVNKICDKFLAAKVDVYMNDIYDQLPFDNIDGGVWKQGWDIKYDSNKWNYENKLKVFVVPHSHNDPGWIKTFENYFDAQTKHILNNMVIKLTEDSRRKFIWAEISYLSLWWQIQTAETREKVKKLVKNGQLEIVSGGWVMPDEANSHYFAMLDQMVTGHEWLTKELGFEPRNGWSIDPFGLSPTMAYLNKNSGLKNMLIQRAHYSIKKHFSKKKLLEFRWRQFWDVHGKSDILCHLMPFYSYDVPHTCGPNPKICCQFDFKRLPGSRVTCPWKIAPQKITHFNVAAKSQLLLDQYRKKSELYRTNVLLVPLGDDFRYDESKEWDDQYDNYQMIFDYLNNRNDLHVEAQFGTLNDYFTALHGEAKKNISESKDYRESEKALEELFPTLSGDFFTYADRENDYWSGYYTSRPFYKRLDRVLMSYLRSAEILFSLMIEKTVHKVDEFSNWVESTHELLNLARQNLDLFQHHDGVTGTSKPHVVIDYANKMLTAINISQQIIKSAAHTLLVSTENGKKEIETESFILQETFSKYNSIGEYFVVNLDKDESSVFYIWNSEPHSKSQIISVRSNTPFVEISDHNGKKILCQVDSVFDLVGNSQADVYSVYFLGKLDAISLTSFSMKKIHPEAIDKRFTVFSKIGSKSIDLELSEVFTHFQIHDDKAIKISTSMSVNAEVNNFQNREIFFSSEGLLESYEINRNRYDIELKFIKYNGGLGGAYLFLPVGTAQEVIIARNPPVITAEGPLVSSLIMINPLFKHEVFIKNSPGVDGQSIEVRNYFDISQEVNTEYGMRFQTQIQNEKVFFTDLNGFQISKRDRYDKIPIQGNFYPMPTQMYIEDGRQRASILSGQPLGCSSLAQGQMEVIFDRRLSHDDNRGLGEPMRDNILTKHVFTILLENFISNQHASNTQNKIAQNVAQVNVPSLISHASISNLLNPLIALHTTAPLKGYEKQWSIGGSLPCDIDLVNLRTSIPSNDIKETKNLPNVRLTLHKRGASCSLPSSGLLCSNDKEVTLSDFLQSWFSNAVEKTSLTQMGDSSVSSKHEKFNIEPMELQSFKLKFSVLDIF